MTMYRPRIIPVLLLKDGGLVKSIRFKDYRYIGDPINAVRIFNNLKADELVFLDITASKQQRPARMDLVQKVGEEANMPFSVGGGIRRVEEIRKIIAAGAEKVILNTVAGEDAGFVREAVNEFGSSTIMVCVDVKRDILGRWRTWTKCGRRSTGMAPVDFASVMEGAGVGELMIQSIERDGTMAGYDVALVKQISMAVSIPVTPVGGAGDMSHFRQMLETTVVNGLAAGSMFVYHGPRKGVLINYPTQNEIADLFDGKVN